MVNERMLELLILGKLFDTVDADDLEAQGYDAEAMTSRAEELAMEFLKPYVIDNAEKSE